MRTFPILSVVIAAWLAAARVQAEEVQARWPQFRGPGGQGIGRPGLKLPATFGPNQHVVWKTALAGGHSSPCIWDDRIFLTGFDTKTRQLETICLERKSGKIRWRRPAPAEKIEKVHEINTPASSTPATDGAQVYVYFGSYGLLCYSMDGELKWQRPLEPIPTFFGSGTSPVVAGELVLLNSAKGQTQLTLLALDRGRYGKRTGRAARQPA
jgi:outer membrane protein assembly factor BamB